MPPSCARQAPRRSILGVDYYEWNERLIDSGGQPRSLGELFGWYVIANQYFERYRRPMMHTETNRLDASDGPRWLWRQWHNVQLLRAAGVPLVGFTWYSLTDQIDWEIGLARPLGTVNAVGLATSTATRARSASPTSHLIDMHRDQPGYRRLRRRSPRCSPDGRLPRAHGYAPGPTQRPLSPAPSPACRHRAGDRLASPVRRARGRGAHPRPAIAATIAAGGWRWRSPAPSMPACSAAPPTTSAAAGCSAWPSASPCGRPARCWSCHSSARAAARRTAAIGVFLALVLWGGVLGLLLPFVQRRLQLNLDEPRIADGLGASLAAQDASSR